LQAKVIALQRQGRQAHCHIIMGCQSLHSLDPLADIQAGLLGRVKVTLQLHQYTLLINRNGHYRSKAPVGLYLLNTLPDTMHGRPDNRVALFFGAAWLDSPNGGMSFIAIRASGEESGKALLFGGCEGAMCHKSDTITSLSQNQVKTSLSCHNQYKCDILSHQSHAVRS
jgi:hypothetical protein